jgi:LAO/AO transport system kinase
MTDRKTSRPDWVPDGDIDGFASNLIEGVAGGHDGMTAADATTRTRLMGKRRSLSIEDHVNGVLSGNRTILAQTITLIESNARRHLEQAQAVLNRVLPETGRAIRVGITGVPGAGKSTFIDSLGTMLCDKGHKVAVLAVDPSSSLSRGSILGDKTRMERLSRQPDCFIRPSPSGGTLGGVGRKTRETMLICEAAGFDVILVETVGVGQSESLVSTMVDFFLLLILTGAGDELQNIKKGVIELADAILINKADGDNRPAAKRVAADVNQALHYLSSAKEGWETKAYCCSALTGEGIEAIWSIIDGFRRERTASGQLQKKRRAQAINWMHEVIIEQIRSRFFNDDAVAKLLAEMEDQVREGSVTVTTAVSRLLQQFDRSGTSPA